MNNKEDRSSLKRKAGVVTALRLTGIYLLDRTLAALQDNARIILREIDLFLGTALLFIGILGFESDKYCDGNTADYLSCTRPTTYYFYDNLDVVLIVLGVFFVILWFLKRR